MCNRPIVSAGFATTALDPQRQPQIMNALDKASTKMNLNFMVKGLAMNLNE